MLAAVAFSLGSGDASAGEKHVLAGVGSELSASHLSANEERVLEIEARPGDYMRIEAHIEHGPITLDLEDGKGRHLRRFASEAVGEMTLHLVAETGVLRLRAASRGNGGTIVLRVVSRIDASAPAPAPAFLSPQIARLAKTLRQNGSTEAFWAEAARGGTPLMETAADGRTVMTFLARGARRNAYVFGAPSGDHEPMARLGQSDVWFRSFLVPSSARLSYQIAPDVPEAGGRTAILAVAQADPLNHYPWPREAADAFQRESTIELPGAPAQPGLAERGAPRGTLATLRIRSAILGNEREVTIYRPAGFDPADPRNVTLVLFDARAYLTKVPTPLILDNLIAEKRIPPVVAVFVSEIDSATRARELPANPDFADFLATELLPRVRRETGLSGPAKRTMLAGSSYGGLAAVTVALRHPETFGVAASLSGSFWWSPMGPAARQEYVAARVAREPRRDLRVHLTAGSFETEHGGALGILETSRHLYDVLQARGYAVSYREYAGGHDYLVWRGALADSLIALWGDAGEAGR